MRVAALYDIHGNLPALEAVLAELEAVAPDTIVVGGDVAGPHTAETLDLLMALGAQARFVRGNHDRDLVDGTDAWAAARITREQRAFVAAFDAVVRLEIPGLGPAPFCHGSPRDDDEDITVLTPASRLEPMLAGVTERVIVCGHSHRQFDRAVLGRRLINAGSVGMPYEGVLGAYWLLLGPDVELRRTEYDVAAAAERMRATGYADVHTAFVRDALLDPDVIAHHLEAASAARVPGTPSA